MLKKLLHNKMLVVGAAMMSLTSTTVIADNTTDLTESQTIAVTDTMQNVSDWETNALKLITEDINRVRENLEAYIKNVQTVELVNWSEARQVVTLGRDIEVYDILTGKVYNIRSFSNGNHADVETITELDTAIMLETFGGDWGWRVRPVLVTINGRTMAASIDGMPHGGGVIADNGMDGQVCLHFRGSQTHNGNRGYEFEHQHAVMEAWYSSIDREAWMAWWAVGREVAEYAWFALSDRRAGDTIAAGLSLERSNINYYPIFNRDIVFMWEFEEPLAEWNTYGVWNALDAWYAWYVDGDKEPWEQLYLENTWTIWRDWDVLEEWKDSNTFWVWGTLEQSWQENIGNRMVASNMAALMHVQNFENFMEHIEPTLDDELKQMFLSEWEDFAANHNLTESYSEAYWIAFTYYYGIFYPIEYWEAWKSALGI